ncbi:MAG: IclR family transcriptional regulator [Trueperaceae bacterium]
MSRRAGAQTVDSALELLDLIANYKGVTLSEVARLLGATTTKTHRLLAALEGKGYLSRTSGKAYELGPKLLYLGHRASRGNQLLRAAAPVLDHLSETTGETALLAVRFGAERLIVDSRDSRFGPQAAWPHDARLPLHSGALGICLLSYAHQGIVAQVVAEGLTEFTSTTVSSEEQLREAMRSVRQNGSYASKGSYVEGIYSIAAPVLGTNREAVAAVSIVGDLVRLDEKKEAGFHEEVRKGAARIAAYLT